MRSCVLVMMLVGCGGTSLDEAANELQRADCSYLVRCGAVETMDACLAANMPQRITPVIRAQVDAGKVRFHGDKAHACATALAARSCDVTQASSRDEPAACREMLQGTLDLGMACRDGGECVSQVCQLPFDDFGCMHGTCIDGGPVNPGLGEPCLGSCAEGLYCDPQQRTCAALVGEHEHCPLLQACDYGLFCDRSGECVALPGPGEPCNGMCRDIGTTCRNGTCVPRGFAGAFCQLDTDCGADYACNAAGHCDLGIALGDSCAAEPHCADPGAECLISVCAMPPAPCI